MERSPGGARPEDSGRERPYDDTPKNPRRPGRQRPLVFLSFALPLLAAGVFLRATEAGALCNIIPPAERTFPSTQGSVRSPIAAPGDEVTVEVGVCDAGPGFATDPADNTITITFLPEGDPDAVLAVTSDVTVEDCAFMDDKCHV
ncbi:MAG: hypothetical protein FJ144_28660, partial [Deltaproteobacteria bacterium]|nr:hypothetical protein [Deltaproteobacteria bacterium]